MFVSKEDLLQVVTEYKIKESKDKHLKGGRYVMRKIEFFVKWKGVFFNVNLKVSQACNTIILFVLQKEYF